MRMLKIFLTFFIVFTSLLSAAQGANFVWAQRFGGSSNDNCYSACDQAGNVYRMDAALTKHSSSGSPLWSITPPFYPQAVSFDAAGDLYVIGRFNGTVDLDHGPGVYTVAAIGGFDMAVIKLSSSNGNFIWGGSMGSPFNENTAIVSTDPSGNLYIGGSFTGVYDVDPGAGVFNFTATTTDFFVSKISTTGNLSWAKQFAGNSAGGINSIDVDASGDVYFCGSFSGTFDFDPASATSNLSTSTSTNNDM